MRGRVGSLGIMWLLLTGGILVSISLVSDEVSAYTPHDPIYINGNSDISAENGVKKGSGTVSLPYIMEGWEIDSETANGIEIRLTDAHLIIRNVFVHSTGSSFKGIYLWGVTNCRVENVIVTGNDEGIRFWSSDNVSITGSEVTSNDKDGIYVWDSDDVAVSNNNVQNNMQGIFVWDSLNVTITDNVASNNTNFNGISVLDSDNVEISGNEAWLNAMGGISFSSITNLSLVGNIVALNQEGIVGGSVTNLLIEGNTILSNNFVGLRAAECNNTTITGNMISGNFDGIQIEFSEDVTISRTHTRENRNHGLSLGSSTNITIERVYSHANGNFGMHLWNSTNINFTRNTVSGNTCGIRISSSSNVSFFRINARNIRNGVLIVSSSDLAFIGNNISDNWDHGVYVALSDNTTFTRNYFYSNSVHNVRLVLTSNNTLSGNIFEDSLRGIYLQNSPNSLVYHNDFVNNTKQIIDDLGNENQYDDGYPSGGNYWNDYKGVDMLSGPNQDQPGSDGKGDTPYVIDINSQDDYPLMEPQFQTPGPPENLQALPGDTFVNLTWSSPTNDGGIPVSSYRIYRSTVPGNETFYTEVWWRECYNDTGLTNGVTYYYKVSARNSLGEGPLFAVVNATPIRLPSEPQDLQATRGDRHVNLTWNAPASDGGSPIANYSIYRGITPGGEMFLLKVGSVLEHTDSNLTNGQKYYYRVSSINAAGEGPQSNEASATPATVPDAPTGLIAYGGDEEVILTWDQPLITGGLSITNYRIYRGDTPGGGTLIFQTLDIETYTNKGLTNGQAYYYQVSAVNNVGEGLRSNETMVIPTSIPGAPGAFQANLDGDALENVTLTWSLSIDDGGGQNSVINYTIFRGSTYDAYGSGYELLTLLPNGTSEFTDNLVGEGDSNNYFYQVCALDLNYKVKCAENQTGKFTRHLPEGQNLVSIPLIQSNEDFGTVLQTLSFDRIWHFDAKNQEWTSYVESKPLPGGFESVNLSMGFWINITEESNLTVAGAVPLRTVIRLYPGWNMVGFPLFDENYVVAYMMAEVSATSIEGLDVSAPPYYLRNMQESEFLLAGNGYWIEVPVDTVWVLQNA